MPQHDLDVANGSGAAVRADINAALLALGSTMKGPNPPPAPIAGMMWLEDDSPSTTRWTLRQYDGADWIVLGIVDSTANRFEVVDWQTPLARAYAEYTANVDLSAAIPVDDTIPQIGEGTEILSVTITPRSITSRIAVEFRGEGVINSGAGLGVVIALFRNGGANAVRSSVVSMPNSLIITDLRLYFEHTPGSTSPQTYSLRIGPQGGTMRLNGSMTGRLMGGTSAATLVARELV